MSRRSSFPSRRKKTRKLLPRIIFVCEGEKTEPHYIQALISHLAIPAAYSFEYPKTGSAPLTIFEEARRLCKEEDRQNPISAIFCVFDKDNYGQAFYTAIKAINALPKSKGMKDKRIQAITSIPCFELWLYLHFKDFTKPINGTGRKSPGEEMEHELKQLQQFKSYKKGDKFPQEFICLASEAARKSKQLLESMAACKTDNPSTLMHDLYSYLKELSPQS